MQTILIQRLAGGTTFKLLFVGYLVFHLSTTLLVAVALPLGLLPLEPTPDTANTPVMLIVGGYLLIGIIFAPFAVGMFWLSLWPGLWVYSLLRPMRISFSPAMDDHENSEHI